MEVLETPKNINSSFLKNSLKAALVLPLLITTACSSIPNENNQQLTSFDSHNSFLSYSAQFEEHNNKIFESISSKINGFENFDYESTYLNDNYLKTIYIENKIDSIIESFSRARHGDVINDHDGKLVLMINNRGFNTESISDLVMQIPDRSLDELNIVLPEEIIDFLNEKLQSDHITSVIIENHMLDFKVFMINEEQAKQWIENDTLNIFNGNISKSRAALLLHELGHIIYPHGASHSNEILADLFAIKYAPKFGIDSNDMFSFFYHHRNVTNADYRSNHTNPFQYDVIKSALDKNPELFDDLNLSQLYQISRIADHIGTDIIQQSISNNFQTKVLDYYFSQNDNSIIDIRRQLLNSFTFRHFDYQKRDYNFSDFKKSILNNPSFSNTHKEDAIAIFNSIEENIVSNRGTFRSGDLISYLRTNQPFIDILNNTNNQNGYLANRLASNLLADLYKKESSTIKKKLVSATEYLGDYIINNMISKSKYTEEIKITYDS